MHSDPRQTNGHLLKAIVYDLADGVIVADIDGSFVLFNPAAENMVGLGARKVRPTEWTEIYGLYRPDKVTPYPPDELPLARALKGEEISDEPIYVRNAQKPSGAWISVTGRPILLNDGTIGGGFVTLKDITEKKRAEERLTTESMKLSAVVGHQRTAILVENEKREIQMVNNAWCDLFKVCGRPSELVGKVCTTPEEQVSHLFVDPEGFLERVDKLLQRKMSAIGERLHMVSGRVLERDYIPVMAGDECLGHVWHYRDMTDREDALERQKLIERLSRALAQTADSVIIADRRGRIEYVNDAFENTTGYSRGEVIGQTPGILKSDMNGPEFYQSLWNLLNSGRPFRGTITNRKKSGELFVAEQTITPMKDDEGVTTHFVSVQRDMTDVIQKREQEVQLRLAREVQQRYYRPVESILGFDIAGATLPSDETGGDYYDVIKLPDNRLAFVIGDVSGHGISAAMVMAEMRAYVRSFALSTPSVREILKKVNRELIPCTADGRFATMVIVCLDLRTRELTWASAGHEFGYLIDSSGKTAHVFESTGIPLGLYDTIELASRSPVRFEKGQTLLLLTDGVNDSSNLKGEKYSPERAIEYVARNRDNPARSIADGLCDKARQFAQNQAQQDDITAVVVKAR